MFMLYHQEDDQDEGPPSMVSTDTAEGDDSVDAEDSEEGEEEDVEASVLG